uniref:Uncharacterized protein n=1 Tax=Tsukubamonas globosa TaxID=875863 RepID=W8VKI5_9EUKA|nr:hypothetical protein [Tsukubamonas globosa]BAO51966.1 hypothetical protein [Tsukubamonas globosa]
MLFSISHHLADIVPTINNYVVTQHIETSNQRIVLLSVIMRKPMPPIEGISIFLSSTKKRTYITKPWDLNPTEAATIHCLDQYSSAISVVIQRQQIL